MFLDFRIYFIQTTLETTHYLYTMEGTTIKSRSPEPGYRLPILEGIIHPAGYLTNQPPSDRPVRIFVHGVFDMFHTGYFKVYIEVN